MPEFYKMRVKRESGASPLQFIPYCVPDEAFKRPLEPSSGKVKAQDEGEPGDLPAGRIGTRFWDEKGGMSDVGLPPPAQGAA